MGWGQEAYTYTHYIDNICTGTYLYYVHNNITCAVAHSARPAGQRYIRACAATYQAHAYQP